MSNKGFISVGSIVLLVAIAIGIGVALETVKFELNTAPAYSGRPGYTTSPTTSLGPVDGPTPTPCSFIDKMFGLCKTPSPTPTIKPAPSSTDSPVLRSGVAGVVTIGPTCPGPIHQGDTKCADKPYQGDFVVKPSVVKAGAKDQIVARFSTDAQGNYSIYLSPGDYIIQPAQLPLNKQSFGVTVRGNLVTQFNFTLDTGLR